MTNLLIGSTNQYKIDMYRNLLEGEANIFTPADLQLQLDIQEDLYDITGNSIKKAKAFASAANMLALSDDSGIFIPALNNEPGVAARRWGGELPATTSDEEWIAHYQKKISTLGDDELAVNRRQVITLAPPVGDPIVIDMPSSGTLLRERAQPTYPAGGPFAVFFWINEFGKAEIDLSDAEKSLFNEKIRANVLKALHSLTYS